MQLMRLLSAGLLLLILCVGASPALAATITVNTTTDEDGSGGNCSLREAVEAADTDGIYGGCAAGSGADVIELPDGTYTLTLGSNIDVDSVVTIQPAAGATSVIIESATTALSASWRVFNVTGTGNLTLNDLTVRNGVASSLGDPYGGCIDVKGSTLHLSGVTVEFCAALYEGGGIGAAIGGTVDIQDSIIQGNQALDDGGGIRMVGGSLSISGSSITNNQSLGGFSLSSIGGGIAYEGETLSISGTTISGNSATDTGGGSAQGGGIAVRIITFGSIGTITNSVITGNTVAGSGSGTSSGGGLHKFGSGQLNVSGTVIEDNTVSSTLSDFGGGVYVQSGRIAISDSRIQRNQADDGGGGFYANVVSSGDSITNSCIVDNNDTSVTRSSGATLNATDVWWGDATGARSTSNPTSGGDSVAGDGSTPINAGSFKTSAPTIAGQTCMECVAVSAVSGARWCELPPL